MDVIIPTKILKPLGLSSWIFLFHYLCTIWYRKQGKFSTIVILIILIFQSWKCTITDHLETTVLIGKRRLNSYYLDLLRVCWPIFKTWFQCTQIFLWPLLYQVHKNIFWVIFSDILAWISNELLKWRKGCQINL